jgi:hypothetical protein
MLHANTWHAVHLTPVSRHLVLLASSSDSPVRHAEPWHSRGVTAVLGIASFNSAPTV